MILLVWPSEKAQDCAKTIQNTFQEEVRVVATIHKGCTELQSVEYSAVLVDQRLSEAQPGQTSVLLDYVGSAIPLFVNFGISSQERILWELRAALSRHRREIKLARLRAKLELHDELTDAVTALLLCCGIALSEPGLSESVTARLKIIEEVTQQIKSKLAAAEIKEEVLAATN
jgi:hypothetical protein